MKRDHNRRNGFILGCLIALVAIVCLASCITPRRVYSSPYTPFSHVIPSRPTLEEIEDGSIPSVVVTNMVLLMNYAEELEIYIEGLKEYYELT